MSEISIRIGEVDGTAELDDALEATRALLRALPLHGELTHGMWSGMTGEFDARVAAGEDDPRVIGLAPGSIALDPEHGLGIVSYGNAESRTALGPHYVVRLGEFRGRRAELLAVLGRMHDEGNKPIVLGRSAGDDRAGA